MTLSAHDCKTSGLTYLRRQFNIGTTTGHIGGNGHNTFLTGLCHNIGLPLVQFGIKNVVLYFAHGQHTAKLLAYLNRCRTHQYRTSLINQLDNLFNNSLIFFALGLIYTVVLVYTGYRLVGRNNHHIQLIDIPKLTGFSLGRTGHTGQLMIHSEIVLKCDSCECLGSGLNVNPLLSLHRLMQTVRPATALHYTSRLFIDNLHLIILGDNIVHIPLEHTVCLEQLAYSMNTFTFYGKIGKQFILLRKLILRCKLRLRLKFRKLRCNVGHNKELRILLRAADKFNALIRKLHAVKLLVNDKV